MFDQITDNEIMMEHHKFLSIRDSNESYTGVKNSLHNHYDFWKKIGAFDDILRIIKNGYNIPFAANPPRIHLKNNKSASQNFSFVSESIEDLIKSGCCYTGTIQTICSKPLECRRKQRKAFGFRS